MTTPDPQTVREIARRLLLNAATGLAPQQAARSISAAILSEAGGSVTMLEHTAWFEAVDKAVMSATFTVSWPDEQPQDTVAPYRPLPYEDEFIGIIQSGSFYAEVTAFRRLAATIGVEQTYRKWTMLQRRARAEAEQPQDDGDVRAVAALLKLGDTSFRGNWLTDYDDARSELESRFADRIAALNARDAKASDNAAAPEPMRTAVRRFASAAEEFAAATTGWILWDAEGRWLHATTSPSDDGWRAVSINEAEAQEWQERGANLDRMDRAGWRAYSEGDLLRWQREPGSRDVWLAARDAKAGEQQ